MRASSAAAARSAAALRRRALVQLHHGGRRHLDQRLLHADRDRRSRVAEIIDAHSAEYARVARCGDRGGRQRWRRPSCATARARPSSSPCASRAARSEEECRQVAYAIAHSPLVKTAFFASDPNLGRILAAIGYAGIADLDVAKVELYLDDVLVAQQRRAQSGLPARAGRPARDEAEPRSPCASCSNRGAARGDGVDLRPVARLRQDQRRISDLSRDDRELEPDCSSAPKRCSSASKQLLPPAPPPDRTGRRASRFAGASAQRAASG